MAGEFNHFRNALASSGIDRRALQQNREIPRLIEKSEIPPEMLEEITRVTQRLVNFEIDMPWLHITSEALEQPDGTVKPIDFVQNIYTNGFNARTNGSAFVRRDGDMNPRVASPDFFVAHPEEFVEDVYHIVKKYLHHGTRSNKKLLGYSFKGTDRQQTMSSQGIGMPILIAADKTGITLQRGVDGDEHYVTTKRILPEKIIGDFSLRNLNVDDKTSVLKIVSALLEVINVYLDRNVQ